MKPLFTEVGRSIMAVILLGVLLCGLYPLVTWGIAQVFFSDKANGSLISDGKTVIGSRLLAQGFTGIQYFHPRPSSAGLGYDASSSGGSNLGPLSKDLIETVRRRVKDYRRENSLAGTMLVPADAVTSSASGLDPHISVENAVLQADRVAKARGMSSEGIMRRISEHTEGRTFGIFGEQRVNVLTLNLALDGRL
jgi:potassium-transporting ATPase KdpC subunit